MPLKCSVLSNWLRKSLGNGKNNVTLKMVQPKFSPCLSSIYSGEVEAGTNGSSIIIWKHRPVAPRLPFLDNRIPDENVSTSFFCDRAKLFSEIHLRVKIEHHLGCKEHLCSLGGSLARLPGKGIKSYL